MGAIIRNLWIECMPNSFPYNDLLDVQIKDIQGIEADSFLLFNNSVVIPNPPNRDKPLIFTSYLELRKFLKEYFIRYNNLQ